jgi:hypothetical protein
MLRALDDAGDVAALLRQAWAEVNGAASLAPQRDEAPADTRQPMLATH